MRRVLIVATLFALAPLSASAKDYSISMPTHREFVQACVESSLEDQGLVVDRASNEAVGSATIECQRIFTKMPGEGTTVSRSMVTASSQVCEEEYFENKSRFMVRYSNSFYHAIGPHEEETEEGDW